MAIAYGRNATIELEISEGDLDLPSDENLKDTARKWQYLGHYHAVPVVPPNSRLERMITIQLSEAANRERRAMIMGRYGAFYTYPTCTPGEQMAITGYRHTSVFLDESLSLDIHIPIEVNVDPIEVEPDSVFLPRPQLVPSEENVTI